MSCLTWSKYLQRKKLGGSSKYLPNYISSSFDLQCLTFGTLLWLEYDFWQNIRQQVAYSLICHSVQELLLKVFQFISNHLQWAYHKAVRIIVVIMPLLFPLKTKIVALMHWALRVILNYSPHSICVDSFTVKWKVINWRKFTIQNIQTSPVLD